MSVVIGFSLQLMAQAHTGPSTAAIILSLEAVFATFFAWLILNEQLGLAALVGCGMIFMGVVLVEAWPTKSDKREETT